MALWHFQFSLFSVEKENKTKEARDMVLMAEHFRVLLYFTSGWGVVTIHALLCMLCHASLAGRHYNGEEV